jgi:hypothetical protein
MVAFNNTVHNKDTRHQNEYMKWEVTIREGSVVIPR